MTEKGGDKGRGRYIGKYLPYSNFPSTGGRELKGGGNRPCHCERSEAIPQESILIVSPACAFSYADRSFHSLQWHWWV